MYQDPEIARLEQQMRDGEALGDFIIFCIIAVVIGSIIYRIVKNSANKRKIQEDILAELRKQNRNDSRASI